MAQEHVALESNDCLCIGQWLRLRLVDCNHICTVDLHLLPDPPSPPPPPPPPPTGGQLPSGREVEWFCWTDVQTICSLNARSRQHRFQVVSCWQCQQVTCYTHVLLYPEKVLTNAFALSCVPGSTLWQTANAF